MAKAASTRTEFPVLPAAPKSDLKVETLERIDHMKTKSPQDGITVETYRLPINRSKLESYHKLRAELEEKLLGVIGIEESAAVIAAGQELREPLAVQLRDGRAPKGVSR